MSGKDKGGDSLKNKERCREFCATVYVLNQQRDALLFVLRRKPPFQGQYLPPGGHLEMNETPDEAAIREVSEETGYDIRILSRSDEFFREEGVSMLSIPINVQIERIDEEHDHIDFIYAGVAISKRNEGTEEVAWITEAELVDYPIPPGILHAAKQMFHRSEWR